MEISLTLYTNTTPRAFAQSKLVIINESYKMQFSGIRNSSHAAINNFFALSSNSNRNANLIVATKKTTHNNMMIMCTAMYMMALLIHLLQFAGDTDTHSHALLNTMGTPWYSLVEMGDRLSLIPRHNLSRGILNNEFARIEANQHLALACYRVNAPDNCRWT